MYIQRAIFEFYTRCFGAQRREGELGAEGVVKVVLFTGILIIEGLQVGMR